MHLGISANEWNAFSDQERYAHFISLYRHFVRHVGYFLRAVPDYDGNVIVDQDLYYDVVSHYYEDLGRWSHNNNIFPDDLKQKAIYAFWLRKVKPISLTKPLPLRGGASLWINEIVAINIALVELDAIYDRRFSVELEEQLRHDLLYFFRYKSVSPHALYLIFAMLYR